MIKFFRRIRQQLLKENKFSKYLIYLNGLKEEFQLSKLKLSELIKVNQQNLGGAKQILEFKQQLNK